MNNMAFIEDENGTKHNINDVKKVTLYKTKYFDGDIEPFIKVKKDATIRRIFKKNIHFNEDGFKLKSFGNCTFGGYFEKYYLSVKDFVEAMKKHWGAMPKGGFYSHLPMAEYAAALDIAPTKNCIEYCEEKNCVKIKPHVNIFFNEGTTEVFSAFGHYKPIQIVKVFDTDEEAENYYKKTF